MAMNLCHLYSHPSVLGLLEWKLRDELCEPLGLILSNKGASIRNRCNIGFREEFRQTECVFERELAVARIPHDQHGLGEVRQLLRGSSVWRR
jgi:hypothetical protein